MSSANLSHTCKISFGTSAFPSRMKFIKVIPLFKSGAKTDLTNYRANFSLVAILKSWKNCSLPEQTAL